MVDFGNKLKKLRQEAGLTQKQLAERMGLTKAVVSYYELQERYPSPEVLIKIASIFHVSTDYLLNLEHSTMLDLTGLNEKDITLVRQLVDSLKMKNHF